MTSRRISCAVLPAGAAVVARVVERVVVVLRVVVVVGLACVVDRVVGFSIVDEKGRRIVVLLALVLVVTFVAAVDLALVVVFFCVVVVRALADDGASVRDGAAGASLAAVLSVEAAFVAAGDGGVSCTGASFAEGVAVVAEAPSALVRPSAGAVVDAGDDPVPL